MYPLISSYWSQAAAMIKYLGDKDGGMDKLKGKKIVHLYHDSAFGKEPLPVLEALSKGLTAKFLHGPQQALHHAQGDERKQLATLLPKLFRPRR